MNDRGRRTSHKVGDRATAKRVARGLRQRIAEGAFGLAPPSPTFRELAEEFLDKYFRVHPIAETTQGERRGRSCGSTSSPSLARCPSRPSVRRRSRTSSRRSGARADPRARPPRPSRTARSAPGCCGLRLILQRAVPQAPAGESRPRHRPLPRPARGGRRRSLHAGGATNADLGAAERQDPAFAALCPALVPRPGCAPAKWPRCAGVTSTSRRARALVRRSYTRGRIGPTKTRRSRVVSILHPAGERGQRGVAAWRAPELPGRPQPALTAPAGPGPRSRGPRVHARPPASRGNRWP